MTNPDTFAIILSIFATGVALAILILRATARLDTSLENYRATANADRRAHQASMDAFRAEMQRLSERQSRVEGIQEVQGGTGAAGSRQ